jgi:1-aminocyclopropane-1-carboxylate deaminase/D-cysteine desulfhydrase-like pyridoxal-dependent ACC family enzyme
LDEAFGGVVHQALTDGRDEREALLAGVVATLRAAGARPFVIGVGGSGPLGAAGQVLAGWELLDQAGAASIRVDRIVLPSATGGTQAGLVVAMAGTSAASVTGVIVARPEAELRPAIADMVTELAASAGVTVGPEAIELDAAQLGDGYGRPTAAAAEATSLLARTEGLLVDPIYTAKALAALVDGVRSGAWDGETVVFWHAGGLPGLFEPLD